MTPDDISQLEIALRERWPMFDLDVRPVGQTRLELTVRSTRYARTDACKVVQTPATLDYRAFDWREWLDRFSRTLGEKQQ